MDNSLSLIVPVHNAENSLGRQIARLLDVLPELTQRFEVLVVDDASTDQTADVAAEIAREYPQVRFIAQSRRLGLSAAARKGSERATGQVVMLLDEIAGLSAGELRRLWNERRESAMVEARNLASPRPFEGPLLDRLSAWGQALKADGNAASHTAESAFSLPELERTDASHQADKKAKPVRSFLRHLRELTLGE